MKEEQIGNPTFISTEARRKNMANHKSTNVLCESQNNSIKINLQTFKNTYPKHNSTKIRPCRFTE